MADRAEDDDEPAFPDTPRAHIQSANHLVLLRALASEEIFALHPRERWWIERYETLLSHGYRLRRRFRPGWIPSWQGTDVSPYFCEDSLSQQTARTIDAKRLCDGVTVVIRRMKVGSEELRISLMLSSPEKLEDPMNHCVPIFDHFIDNNDKDVVYIVMPLLRRFNDPPFGNVKEALDFIRQALQGLVFIHKEGVAHRDLASLNIMMDGSPLYPEGFHPSRQDRSAKSVADKAPYIQRSDAGMIKYYFVDFGLSSYFEGSSSPRLVRGSKAADVNIPELSVGLPYDPFPVDVHTLGNVFQKAFSDEYTNMSFIKPLVNAMTKFQPSDRPSASHALELFEELVSHQFFLARYWRLRVHDESLTLRAFRDFVEILRIARHLPHGLNPKWCTARRRDLLIILFPFSIASFLLWKGPNRVFARVHALLFGAYRSSLNITAASLTGLYKDV